MDRTIRTSYFKNGRIIRINTSLNANRAVTQCIAHMQINQYGATAAEVYDDKDGILHAQVHRSVNGRITITYNRDPETYHNRYAATPLIHTPRRKK
jgi:hypothetical protein